jgi:hypothetical protein
VPMGQRHATKHDRVGTVANRPQGDGRTDNPEDLRHLRLCSPLTRTFRCVRARSSRRSSPSGRISCTMQVWELARKAAVPAPTGPARRGRRSSGTSRAAARTPRSNAGRRDRGAANARAPCRGWLGTAARSSSRSAGAAATRASRRPRPRQTGPPGPNRREVRAAIERRAGCALGDQQAAYVSP